VSIDGTKPPMGFRQYHTINLASGRGNKRATQLSELLRAVYAVAGSSEAAKSTVPLAVLQPRGGSSRLVWAASAAAVIALLVAGLLLWRSGGAAASAVVAVSPADASPASQSYARDLLAQLGQLQSAKPETLQLVGQGGRGAASLVFEVAGATEGQQARANLMLMDTRTGGLLWSKALERPVQQIGDLRQELGYTAAQVLECAVESHPYGRAGLKADTFKEYLNGCAEWARGNLGKDSNFIPLFRRVIAAAPTFEGAWGKLILAESDAVAQEDFPGVETPHVRQLRSDIAAARKISPQLPEAYLAEADLLPLNAYGQRLSLIDRAIASRPDEAPAVARRSELLFAVGRVSDALDDAKRAVGLDPVSPQQRSNYIFALAQAGRTKAALDEIAKAERIWPGSSPIAAARFAINLRFGDPTIARQMIESGQVDAAWIQGESFLQARISHKAEDIERALRDARAAYRRTNEAGAHLIQTLGIFDREDELLDLLMHIPIAEAVWVSDVTFRPAGRELWRNPKSLQYAKRVGLLQYWQTSGKWPDFCGESDLPYDCKKEAAKLAG
jgi:tetratricopeptide (TPR) repeat protein